MDDEVGVGVAVAVSVVSVDVPVGVEDASRFNIWGMTAADSGQLSRQDWRSVWSIFSMVGKVFGFEEVIF